MHSDEQLPPDVIPDRAAPTALRGFDSPLQVQPARRRFGGRLGLLPLVMVVFFTVSGGAYGIEDAVGKSGAGLALLLLLAVPVLWSVPVAFMVSELASAMPVEGGYYAWVKKGLGPFWGFQEGWWSWANSFVDMAIYPVLFADYLSSIFERYYQATVIEHNRFVHWLITLAVIWLLTWLNVRGIRLVGAVLVLLSLAVLLPFGIMSVLGIHRLLEHHVNVLTPLTPPGGSALDALGLGLFVVMWNYLGWDGPSTVNAEVEQPRRNYPRAVWLGLPLVVAAYVFPVIAGLAAVPASKLMNAADPASKIWQEGRISDIAAAVGGDWLGVLIAVGGLVSAAGLFAAILLSNSRLPFVLAEDGYLPDILRRVHRRFATPWISILLCSAIYSVFTWDSFKDLIELDVVTYSAALFLEFAALIALRRSEPAMRRPLRVPGGRTGLTILLLAPIAVLVLAIAGTVSKSGAGSLVLPGLTLASGIVLYPVLRNVFKRGRPDVAVPIELEPAAAG